MPARPAQGDQAGIAHTPCGQVRLHAHGQGPCRRQRRAERHPPCDRSFHPQTPEESVMKTPFWQDFPDDDHSVRRAGIFRAQRPGNTNGPGPARICRRPAPGRSTKRPRRNKSLLTPQVAGSGRAGAAFSRPGRHDDDAGGAPSAALSASPSPELGEDFRCCVRRSRAGLAGRRAYARRSRSAGAAAPSLTPPGRVTSSSRRSRRGADHSKRFP